MITEAKRYGIHLVTFVVITSMMLVSCQSRQANLRDVLTPAQCASACWQGLEPVKTSREEVLNYIEAEQIDVSVEEVLENELNYSWKLGEDHPLFSHENQTMVIVATSRQESVGYIHVGRINLCVNSIIDGFGSPDFARRIEVPDYYELVFQEDGVVFYADNQLSHAVSLHMRSPEDLALNFVSENGIISEELLALVDRTCEDAFD